VDKEMIRINDLAAGYGPLEILHGLDLTIESGAFVCLLGPNGAGKSTLLKTIFGMTTVTRGSIEYGGREISRLKPRQILAQGIAYVPQGRCNFPLMMVEDNLQMAGYAAADRGVEADMERVYELFPILRKRRRQPAGNLSGGEQQMLEMGMAMLLKPQVLLIDEPSIGLSPQSINLVFNEMQQIHKSGCTVILVEQNTRKAMDVGSRVVVLRLGKVIWSGAPSEISHTGLGNLFMFGQIDEPINEHGNILA
jgi:branched-chain amino acid transport system ATP-binding protein